MIDLRVWTGQTEIRTPKEVERILKTLKGCRDEIYKDVEFWAVNQCHLLNNVSKAMILREIDFERSRRFE